MITNAEFNFFNSIWRETKCDQNMRIGKESKGSVFRTRKLFRTLK